LFNKKFKFENKKAPSHKSFLRVLEMVNRENGDYMIIIDD